MKFFHLSRYSLTAIAGALIMSGCASISEVPAGTSYDEVVKEFGNPAVSCPLPDGRTRMIWSQEPLGEQVWATTVGSDRRISSFEQVMAPNMFDQLNEGSWDAAKVRCAYGPPAQIQSFPDSPGRIVWEYRFMGGADNEFMMLFISFDRATNQVVNYSIGPDPEMNLLAGSQ
ncbi:hypothetical protein [Orrella marina]|uniref:Lipoprotein n=1 Tax=Orrella marina TaxID=2163011 RepID=A0A2R4XJY4_9BURK|nr:hypothetical protein [Orrella marina]AWB34120.1 hypothetical protein DBV39_10815 [Orrella marina]